MKRSLVAVAILAILGVSACSTMSDAVDAMNPFAGNGAKLGPLPAITPSEALRSQWSINVGRAGDYVFTPAVVGKAVYAAARDGVVTKIEDGKLVWKVNVGVQLSAGVGANETLLAVGTEKGLVLALDAQDGKLLWKTQLSSEVLAAPTVGKGVLAVKSGDNRLVLLDAVDGARKWTYQRATPQLSLRNAASPVFADRYVFAGFPGGKVVAVDLQNGALAWEGTVAQPKGATELDRVADIVSPPVIDGRQVCATAFQGRVACFDLGQNGALVWARDLSSAAGLVLDGRYLFVTDDRGAVHALDRLSGSSLWKQDKLKDRRVTGPVVLRGNVAVADGEGYIHLLSREDGTFLARKKTDGTPVGLPLKTLGSAFLVQTRGGEVSAIESQ